MPSLRFLLMQVRNDSDLMRHHEVERFETVLNKNTSGMQCSVVVHDLLSDIPTQAKCDQFDGLLLGGSGDYSAVDSDEWHLRVFDFFKRIHDSAKPTFASCWGFQAFARAAGGDCIHDLPRAELGSIPMTLTDAGTNDPIFGKLPSTFLCQAGHQDHVVRLPDDALLLCSSEVVENQAFTFEGLPIYCTQFHPELDLAGLITRVENYPSYVEKIAGIPFEEFKATCQETPESNAIIPRFVDHVFGS